MNERHDHAPATLFGRFPAPLVLSATGLMACLVVLLVSLFDRRSLLLTPDFVLPGVVFFALLGLLAVARKRSGRTSEPSAGSSGPSLDAKSKARGADDPRQFFAALDKIQLGDGTSAAMKHVYRSFYTLLMSKQFDEGDSLLQGFPIERYPDSLLLAVLTITAPAKSNLSNWQSLFHQVKAHLSKSHDDAEVTRLLAGLE